MEKYKIPAQILLGVIALTFIGFGVSAVDNTGSDYIVKVGSQKISEHQLNNSLQNMQLDGGTESRNMVFNALVQRALLTEGAHKMGVSISKEQIKQTIVDNAGFHDQNGRFSRDIFYQYLNHRRISEDKFIEEISNEFAADSLINLVSHGNLVSHAQAEQLIRATQAERTIRSLPFNPEDFIGQVKINDTVLKKYYEENKQGYMLPQAVKLAYIALDIQDIVQQQVVSEEEIRQAFDKESAAVKPKREIAHILFTIPSDASEDARAAVKAEAEKVRMQIAADSAKFASFAKQYSADSASAANGGSLGYLSKNGSLPQVFEERAFSLDKDEISQVVQTAAGYHIIKVLNIRNGLVFEQEKARLKEVLKQQKAMVVFNKLKEQLAEEAFNHPDSLIKVAEKTGLKLHTSTDWFTRESGKHTGMPAHVIDVVFSDEVIKKKHNSEPVAIRDGLIWVVRAQEVREQSEQSFEQAKEAVKADYLQIETAQLAENKAKQVLAELRRGQMGDWEWSPVIKLTTAQVRQSMPPKAYMQLMGARPADSMPAYVLLSDLPVPVVVEVQAVKYPEKTDEQLQIAKREMENHQAHISLTALTGYLNEVVKQKQGRQNIDP